MKVWRVLVLAVGMVTPLLGLSGGCAVSQQEELALGAQSYQKFEQDGGGRYPDEQVQGYVNNVGMGLARFAGRPEMQWQFHVLSSKDINAFAVPGGYIYITQALLFRMQNEAQLAGVLGHECGHIAARHSAKSIERSRALDMATAGLGAVADQMGYGGANDVTKVASQLYLLRYSRDHETEADYLGLKYMTQGGYNPTGMVQVMQILKAAAGGSGGGMLSTWTSTHPDPGNRVEYLSEAIKKDYAAAAQSGKYGEPEFKQNVLSRAKGGVAAGEIDLNRPVVWCMVCRLEAVAAARSKVKVGVEGKGWGMASGRELMWDVK